MIVWTLTILWYGLSLGLAIVGATSLWSEVRARRHGDPPTWGRLPVACACLIVGLGFTPQGQWLLAQPNHWWLVHRINAFEGRPVDELLAEIGPPDHRKYLIYDSKPWYAPLDGRDVHVIAFDGKVWKGRIDD